MRPGTEFDLKYSSAAMADEVERKVIIEYSIFFIINIHDPFYCNDAISSTAFAAVTASLCELEIPKLNLTVSETPNAL